MGLFTSFQLKSRDAETRRRAARSLGVGGKTSAVASLQPLLEDSNWAVRQAAASALARAAGPAAVQPLVAALADRDPDRRRGAVAALGRLADAAAALDALLRHAAARIPVDELRAIAAVTDVILLEPGQVPHGSDRLDAGELRQAAAHELRRRGL